MGASISTTPRFQTDPNPIESTCDCRTCARYSRAYLHHLFRNRELLGYRLATIHNVRWTIRLMQEIRMALDEARFSAFRRVFLTRFQPPDPSARGERRQPKRARV